MKIKKLFVLVVLCLTAIAMLTGCSQSATSTTVSTTTSTVSATTTTSTTSTTTLTSTTSTTSTLTSTVTASTSTSTTPTVTSTSNTPNPTEVEATEFQGKKLTPIKNQRNNALAGTQHIGRDTYKLTVDGLVDRPLSLSYNDLLAYPQISKLMELDCVESWFFTAKWTGPALSDIFKDAGVQAGAKIAIFYTTDTTLGYSSLDLSYINEKNIIIALKLNDITLPDDRGFPFQVVAESKFGYKWAKWIVRIELSADTGFRGFWESRGYNNNADVDGPSGER